MLAVSLQGKHIVPTQSGEAAPFLCSNALLIITLGDDGEPSAYEVLHPDVIEPLVSSAAIDLPRRLCHFAAPTALTPGLECA